MYKAHIEEHIRIANYVDMTETSSSANLRKVVSIQDTVVREANFKSEEFGALVYYVEREYGRQYYAEDFRVDWRIKEGLDVGIKWRSEPTIFLETDADDLHGTHYAQVEIWKEKEESQIMTITEKHTKISLDNIRYKGVELEHFETEVPDEYVGQEVSDRDITRIVMDELKALFG